MILILPDQTLVVASMANKIWKAIDLKNIVEIAVNTGAVTTTLFFYDGKNDHTFVVFYKLSYEQIERLLRAFACLKYYDEVRRVDELIEEMLGLVR